MVLMSRIVMRTADFDDIVPQLLSEAIIIVIPTNDRRYRSSASRRSGDLREEKNSSGFFDRFADPGPWAVPGAGREVCNAYRSGILTIATAPFGFVLVPVPGPAAAGKIVRRIAAGPVVILHSGSPSPRVPCIAGTGL